MTLCLTKLVGMRENTFFVRTKYRKSFLKTYVLICLSVFGTIKVSYILFFKKNIRFDLMSSLLGLVLRF
jgi:hypothetical protein